MLVLSTEVLLRLDEVFEMSKRVSNKVLEKFGMPQLQHVQEELDDSSAL